MITDHRDRFRFLTRRYAIPIGSAVVVGLLTVGAFLFLSQRIPVPQFPPPVFNLRAVGLGNRIYLFLMQRDASSSPPKESWWMKPVEDDRLQEGSEIKPYRSVAAFSDKLWFFNPGMYRIFDGQEWQRFDAPWVGADPVSTAAPEQLWLLSRAGADFSLTSYSHDVWDRPLPVPVDPKDRDFFCEERCPSGLVVFKEEIYYYWLKGGTLYQWILGGEHPGRVESIGRAQDFGVMADPDQITIGYLPASGSHSPDGIPRLNSIGLKVFDGRAWREENGLERPPPAGLLEVAPVLFQGRRHLLINTGIRIEDKIWEPGPSGRSVFLLGGDLGRSVLQYQKRVLLLLVVVISLAAAVLSFALNRWKTVLERPGFSPASVWRRFVAKAVDTALVILPVGILVGSRLNADSLLFPNPLAHFVEAGGMGLMITPLLLFTYHALTEGLWGQTLGKRLCRIRVMDRDLKPCTMLQSVVRNLLRLVDGIGLYGVGLLSIAATGQWQRLGDLAGRTVVVRTKP